MKYYFLFILTLLFFSCGSDNLSNSKAEGIISDCLEKEPIQRSISIQLNNTRISKDNISKYKKIKEEGFIEMTPKKPNIPKPKKKKSKSTNDPLEQWRQEAELRRYNRELEQTKNMYVIKLTDKAEKYIEEAPEKSNWIRITTFNYEVDKVLEVQETPSMNAAKVKVQYKAENITPFAILSQIDPAEFWIKDLKMTKTSNGWKYCDNF